MENNKTKNFKKKIESFILKLTEKQIFLTFAVGSLIIVIGAIGYILNFFNRTFVLLYFNIIGPLICMIGLIVLLLGIVLMNIGFIKQGKFGDKERGILITLDSYTIVILLFIISIFVPHVYKTNSAESSIRYVVGGWEGIILIIISMFLYYNNRERKANIFSAIALPSMFIVVSLDLFSSYSLNELGPGFYLYTVSFIISSGISIWRTILWQKSIRKTEE